MIINSTKLRSDYNRISETCRENGEPVYITKNGDGDTVLMSVTAYENLIERTKLVASILDAERHRLSGGRTYTLSEVSEEMRRIINARNVQD